uniref:Tail-anchored protein insertion receptor WRB n=1 Tax=Setaria digitata TaxID=48799 RepID=A0A915PKB8_9BILA
MGCSTFAVIVNRWYTEKMNVLACFFAVYIFAHWMVFTRWLARKIKEMKSELDMLSPTAHFAAYFKKERNLKQLLADLNALTVEREKESGILSTLLLVVSGIIIQFVAISLMIYSRNVIIGYINSSYFWPFNFLLYIPNISAPISGDDKIEGTPMTLFSFLSLVTFVWKTAYSKPYGVTKLKM